MAGTRKLGGRVIDARNEKAFRKALVSDRKSVCAKC